MLVSDIIDQVRNSLKLTDDRVNDEMLGDIIRQTVKCIKNQSKFKKSPDTFNLSVQNLESKSFKFVELQSLFKQIKVELDRFPQYAGKLNDWNLVSDKCKTIMGCTRYNLKTISMSEIFYLQLPRKHIVDTLLHEVAHVLAPHCKHGPEWKKVAKWLGATPKSCADSSIIDQIDLKNRYKITCTKCGYSFGRNRLTSKIKNSICGKTDCRGMFKLYDTKDKSTIYLVNPDNN